MKAFELHGEAGGVPVVLDSPHSGNSFPDDFEALASIAELRTAEDCYVDELWSGAQALGAPLLAAQFPRAYIDPNRSAGDVDLELIEGPWPWEYAPSGKARIGKSLVWRTLADGRPIYARRLRSEEVRTRIDRLHAPYQRALQSLIEATRRKFSRVYHINCHSMNSVGGRQTEGVEGKPRADFVLGDRDGTTCEAAFTEFVRARLVAMGYDVSLNDPFKGSELVRAYSAPADRRHSLMIEINKRLYMDEATLERTPAFARLQSDLRELLKAILEFA